MGLTENTIKKIRKLGGRDGWWNKGNEVYMYMCIEKMKKKGFEENEAFEILKDIYEIIKDEYDA